MSQGMLAHLAFGAMGLTIKVAIKVTNFLQCSPNSLQSTQPKIVHETGSKKSLSHNLIEVLFYVYHLAIYVPPRKQLALFKLDVSCQQLIPYDSKCLLLQIVKPFCALTHKIGARV